MPLTCSVYGLGLRVNVPLAGLAGLAPADHVDLRVDLEPLPPHLEEPAGATDAFYVSSDLDEHGRPLLQASRVTPGGDYRIDYFDGTVVLIDHAGSRVWAGMPAGHTIEDTAAYLLGPILGVVLRLRGVTCLHASAVAVDGRALALVGPSGAGKSSTAAGFAQLGHPVLSDDVLALAETPAGGFRVQPAYPRIRLWPESVAGLFGTADALPRITPNWDKRCLDLNRPGYRFQSEPLPLAAIYWLGERLPGPAESRIEALRPSDALIKLVAESYATNFQDRSLRAREFDLLSRLVDQVPVRILNSGSDITRIPDRCRAILADFRQA